MHPRWDICLLYAWDKNWGYNVFYNRAQHIWGIIHGKVIWVWSLVAVGILPSVWYNATKIFLVLPHSHYSCRHRTIGLWKHRTFLVKNGNGQNLLFGLLGSYINGLLLEKRYSIANALKLCISCTNPSMLSSNTELRTFYTRFPVDKVDKDNYAPFWWLKILCMDIGSIPSMQKWVFRYVKRINKLLI